MNPHHKRLLAIVLLLGVIGIGAYLRVAHLGAYNLVQDELSQLYVGHQVAHGKPPLLPSGQRYERGLEYARLTDLSTHLIESPEVAVRLPSALLGTLCLIVMAAGTWLMAGPWAAVIATLLFAVYPETVAQSRLGRFYMLQMLFGLLAVFGGWLILKKRFTSSRIVTWLGAVAVSVAWLYAARIQVTAFPTLLAWFLYLAIVGVRDLLRASATWRRNVPLQVLACVLLLIVALLSVDPMLLDDVVVRALSMPHWARVRPESVLFYLIRLIEDLSTVALIAPFAFAYLLLRRRKLGEYLLVMFAVPAFVFSVVLPFKAERFLLLAIPPLFIAVAAATADAGIALMGWTSRFLLRWSRQQRTRDAVAVVSVAIVGLGALLAMRSPRTTWNSHWTHIEPKWDQASVILNARSDLAGIPFGATKSLPPKFYWGRVDFNVGRNFLEQWTISPLGEAGVSSGRVGAYVTLPIGSRDLYAGVPVLTTPASIRSHFSAAGAVVVGVDGQARYFRMIDADLLKILETEGVELCEGRCGSLQVYLWRFR